MNYIEAVILGLVQGLTEFIPISSSGHLVFIKNIFGFEGGSLFFDVVLHMGTLLAVLIYFRKDLYDIVTNIKRDQRLFWMIILGTVPAVVVGVLFSDIISFLGETALFPAIFLMCMGAVFLFAEKKFSNVDRKDLRNLSDMTMKDAIIIGLIQACALLPGISRSGVTISTGMIRGVARKDSARFSFLLSIPVILGAGLYTAIDAFKESGSIPFTGPMFAGFLVSFISGLFAIKFLMKYLEKYGLKSFAVYMFIAGGSLLLFYFLG